MLNVNKAEKIFYLSRKLHVKKVPYLPKVLNFMNRVIFTTEISHKANIENGVKFPHNGMGVIIHEKAVIGTGSKIMQQVSIGGNLGKEKEVNGNLTTAPVIGSNVFIGAGSKILGPVKIGDNAVIGAGSIVLDDVPENGVAVGMPAKVIKIKDNKEQTAQ